MKIIYFGSSSPLSLIPLKTLINSEHELCAIVVNDNLKSDINVITPNTIKSLAFKNAIPVLDNNIQLDKLVTQLTSFQADLIVVSCFASRIPAKLLATAKKGGVNLHPSLLPLFRGPEPLFWQYREGVKNFGITLHRLTDEFDAGNIISQQGVHPDDGISIEEATQKLAIKTSDLLLKSLKEIEYNNTNELKQNQGLATYQSFPTENDFSVSTSWSVKRIYNFINAYKSTSVTFLCDVYGRTIRLTNAKSYQATPFPGMGGKVALYNNSTVIFACKDGYIECEMKD